MRVSCRSARQAGSTIGSKTWTTLDSLELVDQPAALVPLEALPQQSEKALTGTASALEDDSMPKLPGVLFHASLNLLMPAKTQDTWPSDCIAIIWMPHVALSLRSLSEALRSRIGHAVTGGSAQQMRIVARAGSSASDHREGEWVSVQPAHSAAEALPQWTAQQASVLWLCVRPGATVMRPFHSQFYLI